MFRITHILDFKTRINVSNLSVKYLKT